MRKLIETNGIVWNCAIVIDSQWNSVAVYSKLLLEARKDFDIDSNSAMCGRISGQGIPGYVMLRFQIPIGSEIPAGWEVFECVKELGNR